MDTLGRIRPVRIGHDTSERLLKGDEQVTLDLAPRPIRSVNRLKAPPLRARRGGRGER